MSFLRQLILSLAVIAGALFAWITYVPSAVPILDRIGVLTLLGVDAASLQSAPQAGAAQRRGGGASQVLVSPVREEVMTDRVTAIGDGRAHRSVIVRADAVGTITELSATAGTYTEAGTVIARLDNEAETIALERARITLADAQDEAQRLSRLETTGAVTEVRLREAELALRTAELAVRQAEYDLSKRRIDAPISGWLGLIDVEPGDRVAASDVVARITDRSRIVIDFRVPERIINQLRTGGSVEVVPLGLRGTVLQGAISAIDTVVDRASRTLRVQAEVENAADRLRAGMAFSVALSFAGDAVLALEPLSLQWSSEGAFVWAVREGKAARVPVTILQRTADSVLVKADLDPGEPVVTEGVQSLRPGAEVSIADQTEAALRRQADAARGEVTQ